MARDPLALECAFHAEWQGNGDGLRYLIAVTATNGAGTSFDVYTV